MISLTDPVVGAALKEEKFFTLAKTADLAYIPSLTTFMKQLIRKNPYWFFYRSWREAYNTAERLERLMYSNKLVEELANGELRMLDCYVQALREVLRFLEEDVEKKAVQYRAGKLTAEQSADVKWCVAMYNMAERNFVNLFGEDTLLDDATREAVEAVDEAFVEVSAAAKAE